MAETILKTMAKDGLKMDDDGGIEIAKAVDRLRAGTPMRWCFSAAFPIEVADGFEIRTPEVSAKEPVQVDDLTSLIELRDRMQTVNLQAGMAATAQTYASDRVVLTQGWREHDELIMLRDQPRAGDSGWFVQGRDEAAPEGGWQASQLVAHRAWQLVPLRPELVWAMNLPVGYVARVAPGRIIAIRDAGNRLVAEDITF